MTWLIDVRYEDGTPIWARVHFPNIEGTARFDIQADGTATFNELEVPTSQANGAINKAELDALNNSVAGAKTQIEGLDFVTGVN
jgi:hypothetical protein